MFRRKPAIRSSVGISPLFSGHLRLLQQPIVPTSSRNLRRAQEKIASFRVNY